MQIKLVIGLYHSLPFSSVECKPFIYLLES